MQKNNQTTKRTPSTNTRADAHDENRHHRPAPGKKEQLGLILADPRFDEGITIVERNKFGLPALTQDLDERSLLGYIALLQKNDSRFTTMLQELLKWMKNLQQP